MSYTVSHPSAGRGELASGLDARNREILQALYQDATIPTARLARQIGLSTGACVARIKKLEKEGYIQRYTIALNHELTRCKEFKYLLFKLKEKNEQNIEEFGRFVQHRHYIVECDGIEGEYDFVIKVGFPNRREWNSIRKEIASHQLCHSVMTLTVVSTIRNHEVGVDQIV